MNHDIPTHAAKAVIKNEAGDILFLQRNPAKGAVPNWDLPGGLVEPGESDKEALVREIKEELGATAIVGDKVGVWHFYRQFDGATVEVTNYSATVETEEFTLSDEHVDSKWTHVHEVSKLDIKDPSLIDAIDISKK